MTNDDIELEKILREAQEKILEHFGVAPLTIEEEIASLKLIIDRQSNKLSMYEKVSNILQPHIDLMHNEKSAMPYQLIFYGDVMEIKKEDFEALRKWKKNDFYR